MAEYNASGCAAEIDLDLVYGLNTVVTAQVIYPLSIVSIVVLLLLIILFLLTELSFKKYHYFLIAQSLIGVASNTTILVIYSLPETTDMPVLLGLAIYLGFRELVNLGHYITCISGQFWVMAVRGNRRDKILLTVGIWFIIPVTLVSVVGPYLVTLNFDRNAQIICQLALVLMNIFTVVISIINYVAITGLDVSARSEGLKKGHSRIQLSLLVIAVHCGFQTVLSLTTAVAYIGSVIAISNCGTQVYTVFNYIYYISMFANNLGMCASALISGLITVFTLRGLFKLRRKKIQHRNITVASSTPTISAYATDK